MAQIANGPELTEVYTNGLGFKTLAGEVKVQLPTAWPQGVNPPTTSSLLSIAASKGLLAAAGPDSLVILSTDRIRSAFKDAKSKNETVQLQADLSIQTPRLSHVAFSSDDTGLIVAAESGGGLAVYAVEGLLNKATAPIVEMSTQGVALKSLVPNPAPSTANFVAALLTNGHLMLADLQDKKFLPGPNGPSIKDNVTSVAWSVRGKQLVAGLADGTAVQIDQQGNIKATIPRPPGMGESIQMSSIVWLANDEFLTTHTVSAASSDSAPEAVFHWVRTDKDRAKFEFRKSPNEPCFALHNRAPASYFISRIRKWSQLEDAVILTSAASSDVGLLTNSQVPLNTQNNASEIVNSYTFTMLENDARKASLPMSLSGVDDTFPVGQAIDYSSKDTVWQPIPGDDAISDSPHPLPAVAVLNAEGILSYWWFVNDEGIRKSIPCPGLVAVESNAAPAQTLNTTPAPLASSSQPAFGSSGFGAATPGFGIKPTQPAFGSPSPATPAAAFGKPAFGQPAAFGKPAFVATPALGSASPWASKTATPAAPAAAFGKPTFGTPAGIGFGQTGALGQKSPWGSAAPTASTAVQKSPFGGDASAAGSGFAKFAQNQPTSSFASMGAKSSNAGAPASSPFASMGAAKSATPFGAIKQESSFGQTPQQSFGSTVTVSSATGGSTIGGPSLFGSANFGTPAKPASPFSTSSSFKTEVPEKKNDQDMSDNTQSTQPSSNVTSSLFGLETPFKAAPTFKPAETAKEKDEIPESKASTSGFGLGSLGAGLGNSMPEVKPDPDLPQRSLFDIPARSIGIDEKSLSKTTEQPEPPEVTSKPAPSSSSGTYSGQSSTIVKSIENNNGAGSPEIQDANGEDDAEDNDDSFEQGDEFSNEPSSHDDSEGVITPARAESGPASSPPSADTSSQTPDPSTPFGNIPSAPRSVLNLKGIGSSRSPLGESTGVPPPAPTPPVSAPFPSFKSSTTPAGLPHAPIFAPPKQQELPRSPSPVRRTSRPASQKIDVTTVPQPTLVSRSASSRAMPEEDARTKVAVLSDLHDDTDDVIREELSKPLEPSLDIAEFIAHTDYAGTVSLDGVSGNIERVYRDINSMIDSLGRNARALAAFVAGHQDSSDADPDGTDLHDATRKWTLDDIDRLKSLEHNLEMTLLQDPIKNTNDLRAEIVDIKRRLRPVKDDQKKMKSFFQAYKDPSQQNKRRNAPLDPNAAAYQRQLLTQLAIYKKMLAEAEDKATIVKAKLAARGASRQAPTVEAVEKTIRKMTAMVQQRSMEVDHLERLMRKMGISGASSRPGSTRPSPAKGRSFGLVSANGNVKEEEEEEREWRLERAVLVRRQRRNILNKIRQELDKRDLSAFQKVPDGY